MSHPASIIELRNLRRDRASHPDLAYYADLTIRVQGRDIEQEGCCLAPTVRNLLGTLVWDHEGQNGANDNALLVGDCGEPGCCGVDFGVAIRGDTVELSWPDPSEMQASEARFLREHPHEAFFPNQMVVGRVSARVAKEEYVGKVLRLAAAFLRTRARLGDRDEKTQKLFEWCGSRHPELFRKVQEKEAGSDLLRFEGSDSK